MKKQIINLTEKNYQTPAVQQFEVNVEKGFAGSGDGNTETGGEGGDDDGEDFWG